jgi:hypothetical protein
MVSSMVFRHSLFLFFSFSLFLLTFSSFLFTVYEPIAAFPTQEYDPSKEVHNFYFNNINMTSELIITQMSVRNEATIQVYYYLYPNSTSNITLLIEPEDEWNETLLVVRVHQEINVTLTNGVVITPPRDVPASFDLFMQLDTYPGEVWGTLMVTILNRGWEPIPWPIGPVVLALVLFWVLCKRKKRQIKGS